MTKFQLAGTLRRLKLRTYRWLIPAAACVALAGCAAVPVDPGAITAAPEAGRAVIIGWGNTAAENARAALTPEKGTRVSSLFVSRANTQKISSGENIARVPPGAYELTISCGLYIDYRVFSNESVVHATLNANRVYRLRAAPQGRTCQPFLEDVTGKGS